MNQTKSRILQTAEILFAKEGIAKTSLRRITAEAGANLAAVNYHFGNKQNLVHEVFKNRLDSLNAERIARLDKILKSKQKPELEPLLEALIFPALDLSRDKKRGGSRFVKVMARAYAENDSDLHAFLSDHYGYVIKRFAAAIKQALPGVKDNELRWQLDFVIGALTYVMADFGEHFSTAAGLGLSAESLACRLVQFAAAGMNAFCTEKDYLPASKLANIHQAHTSQKEL
jgi:AcrR family transcriptional regulator